jgi:hypothetical protein
MSANFNKILGFMKQRGYVVYNEPYQLNIVGVRNSNGKPNVFDDRLYAFYKNENGQWIVNDWPITTDPGTYWLENPMSNLGTAMLKEGQYVNAFKRGLHKGQYTAVVEAAPVTVYRDYDRNAIFDIGQSTSVGNYGINIHRAGTSSSEVDKWSAGCQVFQKSADFNEFMTMVDQSVARHGNQLTYTLIDERMVNRRSRRIILFASAYSFVIVGGYFLVKKLTS